MPLMFFPFFFALLFPWQQVGGDAAAKILYHPRDTDVGRFKILVILEIDIEFNQIYSFWLFYMNYPKGQPKEHNFTV